MEMQQQATQQNALATSNYNRVRNALRSPDVMSRFAEVLGQYQAGAYVASVLVAVANSNALQNCTIASIVTSAMRAATLKLSCDPSVGHAYLVPFKGRCTLVIGYKGLQHMAVRSGKYRFLNIAKVREGELVEEDWLTGIHKLAGKRLSEKVTGYVMYFELYSGFAKSVFMSVEEIHAHAQRYSKSYGRSDSPWTTNAPDMEKKTIMRLGLSHWGYFDPHDAMNMNSMDENDSEDANIVLPDDSAMPKISQRQAMSDLGFDTDDTPEEPAPAPAHVEEPEEPEAPPMPVEEAPAPAPQPKVTRPYPPEVLKVKLAEQAKRFEGQGANGKRNEIAPCLNRIVGGDAQRKQLMGWLVENTSSKDLPDGMVIALYNWLKPSYDKNIGAFVADPMASKEAGYAHEYALKQGGNQPNLL